ncbi:MAG: Gfo/Idh/MocA family oxidoreductase [Acidobacteriota bacterium]
MAPSSADLPGIGLVGCGYWGEKVLRNLAASRRLRLDSIAELDADRLGAAVGAHPGLAGYADYRQMLRRPGLDAVVVATPAATHFEIAHEVLRSGRPVLVEKPLATDADQARTLVEEAERRGLALMVGHTFVYSGAVETLGRLIDDGELGTLRSYDGTRVNLGRFQPDVNVLWDLAVHDLAILDHVVTERPAAISATGAAHLPGQATNLAYATLFYPDALIAHLHVSWLAPIKQRSALITGSRRMVVYDDTATTDKLRLFDAGVDFVEGAAGQRLDYRTNGFECPDWDPAEPLRTEVDHFADCVATGARPRSDGFAGLRAVTILEAACRSLEAQGRLVELPSLAEGPSPSPSRPTSPGPAVASSRVRAASTS